MTVELMIETVERYIKIRKNQDVRIVINSQRDLFLLTAAYEIATEWLLINNQHITN